MVRKTPGRSISVADIRSLASNVFDDSEQSENWFETVNHTLGGKTPQSLVGDPSGRKQVYTILVRILDGVFS
ncbi:MAG: antitoxin Xre/MbcA/ParS toxin-binding domain-containing protein [Woeseiaceae bacterium]